MASRKQVEDARKGQIKDGKKLRAEQKGEAINNRILDKGKGISASKNSGKGQVLNEGKSQQVKDKTKKPSGRGY